MNEETKVDRDVPIAINPIDKSRRDGAIHRIFGKKLHHTVPSWVPDGSRFHIRIRVAPDFPHLLTDPARAELLLESVIFYHERQRWHATLFLLMPDHIHAILSLPPQVSMPRVIGDWKRYHAKERGVAWQNNFFDHRLRNDAEADLKYGYIRRNPVVKNFCASPDDWPWFVAF